MLRVLSLFVCFLCALAPFTVHAQTLSLRAGEHDGYSRLVFDWGRNVPYTMSQPAPGKVIIKFTQPGSVDPSIRAQNLSGISVISQSPLQLSLSIPAKSKVRDFAAGNKLFIDIYDAPGTKRAPPKTAGAAPPPVPAKPPEKAAEAKPVEAKTAATPAQPAAPPPAPEAKKQANMLKPAPDGKTAGVEDVVGADLAPPLPAKQDEDQLRQPSEQRPSNLITLSSIDAVGMAVFDRDGAIWMVCDKDNLMISPQVSGPDAGHFLPVETTDIPGGKIFRMRSMGDTNIRGQGGGLLWRVVVPAGPAKITPTKPVRVPADPKARPPSQAKIVWPFGAARKMFNILDPVTGKQMFVITVDSARKYAGDAMHFIDFDTVSTPVGLAIIPRADDLQVSITRDGDVEVTRPKGLVMTSQDEIAAVESAFGKRVKPGTQENAKRIFDFRNWEMGGIEALDDNRNLIMANIGGKQGSEHTQGLLTLAKMYLANSMWAEAKGFLDLAQDEMPELNQNAGFIALHGAAQALGLESEEAFKQLSDEDLKEYPEIGYWRAYTLADLGDWQQADSVFPDELYILSEYSPEVKIRLSLVLAEVALRAGDTAKGEQLLGFAEEYKDQLNEEQMAAMNYLKGEAARQRGKTDDTKKYWGELARGSDDMYRAKAGLALTRLLAEKKELTPEKAIDNLERLRYAWRGDELEAQIAYWLGRSYFEHKDFVKGLVIMREAAGYAEDTDVGRKIVSEMTDVFKKLFLGPDLDNISALDAAALHDQFNEYIPEGPEGDKIARRLAERLVKADLLDKASELLKSQVDRLPPDDAYRVITRLAAIYLIDDKPAQAIDTLNKADEIYAKMPDDLKSPQRQTELALLRARALSSQDRFEQALALLNGLGRQPDVNNLRADIAWHAGYWDDAAQALGDVILDRNISMTRPLSDDNTALILQRAVALNLASDAVGLADMRAKYSDAMAQTDKARIFEVVTRQRQSAALADRKTLMGIVSEVDLFKDFLEGYKDNGQQQTAAGATPAATPPAAPATPAAPPPSQ